MSSATAGASADLAHTSRRAIVAACVGNAAEWYDFAIYGSLATVIGLVFFPTQDLATALSAAFATYGTAFLVRPLGALLFGRLGDAHGRRTVLVRVVFLMAGATTCVALLPGYATIGLLAPVVLVLLRAAQGLAAGGELGVAAVFILETRTTHEEARLQPGTQRRWRLIWNRHGCGRRALLPFQRDRS
jgi:MFS transporter, MHS family, proline/betaine transporter